MISIISKARTEKAMIADDHFHFKKWGSDSGRKASEIYTQPTIETLVTEKETTIKSRGVKVLIVLA